MGYRIRTGAFKALVIAGCAGSLSACAGINRFDGLSSAPPPRGPQGTVYQTPPNISGPSSGGPSYATTPGQASVGSGPITSEPLPPPNYPGSQQPVSIGATPITPAIAAPPPLEQPPLQTATAEPPTLGGATLGGTTLGGGRQVATLGGNTSGGRGPVTSRDGVIGGWTAREANGTSCKVTLSSSPALDLYRASAGNCANKELQKVTGWDYRDGEVYLYQPGGAVAARMRVNDGASLSGSIARSGAGLNLSR
jgi:Protease inhibitor Inh